MVCPLVETDNRTVCSHKECVCSAVGITGHGNAGALFGMVQIMKVELKEV